MQSLFGLFANSCVADFEEQLPATSNKCLQDLWQVLGVRFPRMSWALLRLILAKSSSLEGCPFSSLSCGHLEETHTLFPLHKFCEILSLLSQERRSSVQVSSNYCEDSPWSIVENFEGPSSHCNINKRSNLLVGAWDFSHGILSPHLEGGFSWVDWHLHGLSFHTSFTYMHALIGN